VLGGGKSVMCRANFRFAVRGEAGGGMKPGAERVVKSSRLPQPKGIVTLADLKTFVINYLALVYNINRENTPHRRRITDGYAGAASLEERGHTTVIACDGLSGNKLALQSDLILLKIQHHVEQKMKDLMPKTIRMPD
jgi:hypothetical protein